MTAFLTASLVFPTIVSSQENESPNQKSVAEVIEPAPVSPVKATIVPLIWRAKIGETVVAVPLRSIEYYGVQIYDTDSQTRVRELTICTESQSLIRIYYTNLSARPTNASLRKQRGLGNLPSQAPSRSGRIPLSSIQPPLMLT